jgi:preprotein translocase subunit SecB
MQISPLQLEQYFLKKLTFSLTSKLQKPPPADIEYERLDVEINADTQMREGNPRRWRCELSIRAKYNKKAKVPYDLAIGYVGFFLIRDEVPDNLVETIARANAPAVLYSAAREALVILCSRPGFPAVLLPSVTFVQSIKAGHKGQPKRAGKRRHRVALKK